MLMAADELARRLDQPDPPVVLDVRWRLTGPPAQDDYRAGHVPGAVWVDLDRDLAAPRRPDGAGGRHPLPDGDDFGRAMRAKGVRSTTAVVCYDDRDGTAAARAWWLLIYFGHASVFVLDGGFAAWVAAGHPVTTEVPRPAPGDFEPEPGGGHLSLIGAEGAAGLAGTGLLLDARAVARYRGEAEPVDPVAGHIPGAVSAPTSDNVGPDGRFLAAQDLRRRFEDLGATVDRPLGVYCGSGVTAAHEVLALRLAGFDAALYAGSWSDWVSDPDRPVATGPA